MTTRVDADALLLETQLQSSHQLFPSEIREMQGDEHSKICSEFFIMLRLLFEGDENAAVGSDIGFYWNNQDDREWLSPDGSLIRNAGNTPRQSWKFWEERAAHPNLSIEFVLEVWSPSNRATKRREKMGQYQRLGAREFFDLDPKTGKFFAHRLVGNVYEPIAQGENGRFFSEGLQAELVYEGGLIRLYRDGHRLSTFSEAQAELSEAQAALDAERTRAERLAQKLRELGINPNNM
jgi:Uma2 family endonuclease